MKSHWSEKITGFVGSTTSIVVHTILFVLAFLLVLFGVPFDRVLLVLTTIVSLEAIYLSLFIQMTVNRNTQSLEDIEEDVEEMQEDVEEITEDLDEITEDLEEVQEDLGEIQEDDQEDEAHDKQVEAVLGEIQKNLEKIMSEVETLKRGK